MLDEELTLKKSDNMGDWYTIERKVHDGKAWLEDVGPGVSRFMLSCRIGAADIEGTAAEMVAIARAIKSGQSAEFRRCAAYARPGGWALESPRNSEDATFVPAARCQALADEILAVLAQEATP